MKKKIAFAVAAFLVLLIFGALIYFYFDFSFGIKRVDKFYKDSKVEKIRDLSSYKNFGNFTTG